MSRLMALARSTALASLLLGVGCATEHGREAEDRAEELVKEAHATGLAPDLDAQTAKSLYGDDAEAVCGPLEDDPNVATWSRLLLHGMPEKTTDELVAYDRLVVATYCPDRLRTYDDLLERLHFED